jgi:2-C-methyl-D-erythritol 2,4-cyclodiphosphate synthase
MLGGVHILCEKGETGHSDGDVLIHAIIDALLGACCVGDIGELFPDTDISYKNADSAILLQEVWRLLREKGCRALINIDCVVSLEKPAILPYKGAIRASLAALLGVSLEQVYVKGKTGEGLGDVGAGRAIEALAVALVDYEKI